MRAITASGYNHWIAFEVQARSDNPTAIQSFQGLGGTDVMRNNLVAPRIWRTECPKKELIGLVVNSSKTLAPTA
jgi:hypothetical protein